MGQKGSRKVRTGCFTCRIRRVKCDEAKPHCDRCTKTGRHCDGYPPKKGENSVPLPLKRLLPSFQQAPRETRALKFFHTRAARSLSGPYDGYFWTSLVMQLCHSEPVVRHAVIAISTLYEDFSCKGRQLSRLQTNEFALSHYNSAVRKLRDVQYEPLVLLACLLFVCIEVIQDNRAQAILHSRHGLTILNNIQNTAVWSQDYLAPIFHRLSVMPVFFGSFSSDDKPRQPLQPVPSRFRSLYDANHITEELVSRTMQLSCAGDEYRYGKFHGEAIRPELLADQAQLMIATERLRHALATLGQELLGRPQGFSRESKAWFYCCVLRAELCQIWSTVALDLHLRSYDQFLDKFRYMVELGNRLGQLMDQRKGEEEDYSGPALRFEIGYLAITWAVVGNCRHLATRLEALRLVRTYGAARESFWESGKMYQLGRRLIEVEHDLELDEDDQPITHSGSWIDFPPEDRRVLNSYLNKDSVVEVEVGGEVLSGVALGLLIRDLEGSVRLQNEFIFVEPDDCHSKPRLVKLDKAYAVPFSSPKDLGLTKCVLV
ncbi:hypothetical protein BX600DRAFT_555084 [Xylariales sp. PMI_506]|nr:hypothetical protein BX600DRAFT_555084 [Xylariales sp. PMI_506]